MLTEVVSLISVLIAVGALLLTLWQNILTRRAAEAQVFLALEQLARESQYWDGVNTILTLKGYSDFSEFSTNETQQTQLLIFSTVEFLNFAAHLIEKKYLPRQSVWDLFFWGYRSSGRTLLPWWLEEQRRKHPRRFATFERMCHLVNNISREEMAKHDHERVLKAR